MAASCIARGPGHVSAPAAKAPQCRQCDTPSPGTLTPAATAAAPATALLASPLRLRPARARPPATTLAEAAPAAAAAAAAPAMAAAATATAAAGAPSPPAQVLHDLECGSKQPSFLLQSAKARPPPRMPAFLLRAGAPACLAPHTHGVREAGATQAPLAALAQVGAAAVATAAAPRAAALDGTSASGNLEPARLFLPMAGCCLQAHSQGSAPLPTSAAASASAETTAGNAVSGAGAAGMRASTVSAVPCPAFPGALMSWVDMQHAVCQWWPEAEPRAARSGPRVPGFLLQC